jgi:predicted PurR-regulated permease PerM
MLGVVFGIWGLALALPLLAIVKVMIDHFKAEGASPESAAM